MNILVVEDNESVCSMLEMFFMKEGYQGTFVHDGQSGFDEFNKDRWDLIIVDWMLPLMDGVTLCRKIRELSGVPIIMLTAKDSESDQVLGLEMGADDYVTKPFSPLTLMARIKAVTRRFQTDSIDKENHFISSQHFKISKDSREAYYNGELLANLTPKEFDLLYYFIKHPKQVFSREQLLDKVWGYQFYGDERTVDVHIKRLRKKISNAEQPFIHTVWGVGYKFDETADSHE
ncbi:two-component system, OmpR family, response regulator [Cytobacillus horneckiae]|uniref:DNA-binding response regulator n=1 Tax=Cytobacillus horneckiae TaxID=549687 RepID=A0A2N0ZHL8_9BACI|nr:response regulator transcription factor [Cytobacillus horneckiae]NRG47631.1 response regulator transcription factor [Bacillus sp. CRN 9]MBN6887693.1 response regulator transcription factor [Cytobacillus horneckiae]MCM3178750.1 response regulator transcription factor [Cytobacillus horneckiae]MEC1158226.1 response regulator transcription factor [Cytobacillus horneckiae]MED2940130.1 response regulator transcription factor [Cytobacillus horneckiae]